MIVVGIQRVLRGVALCAVAIAPLACASKKSPRSQLPEPAPVSVPAGKSTGPLSAKDACAARLHDLCGPLLYYFAINRRMPERLEDLRDIGGPEPDIEFACPVSGKPYVYDPQGLPRRGQPGVLVLYDAEPSHSGMRWAVAVEAPKPGQPLIPHIVAEPESTFQAAP